MSVNVKSLVQTSAEVITIVNLKKGDVYSRLDSGDSGYPAQMVYGIVTGVHNNGTDTVFTSVEYGKQRYSEGFSAETRVFKTADCPQIFETDPDEFKVYLQKMQHSAEIALQAKQRELSMAEERLDTILKISKSGELSKAETIKSIEPISED